LEHDGRTYSVSVRDLEAPRCEKCGEIVLDGAANRQISSAFREQLGLLTPEQIRGNREALGLTQRQLANLLSIAEATLSRWETGGQIQQRSLDKLLRLFFGLPEVRLALSDEVTVGGLGSAMPVATTDTAGPSDEELTEALKTAWNEAMASLRTSFQRRRQRALSRRWRDKESDISRCILPVVHWCLQADRRSLRHWIACFDRETSPLTRKPLDKHQPGQWLVIRLPPPWMKFRKTRKRRPSSNSIAFSS
jgi:putative zinc finger/helix-turn-helix YgiT family protein